MFAVVETVEADFDFVLVDRRCPYGIRVIARLGMSWRLFCQAIARLLSREERDGIRAAYGLPLLIEQEDLVPNFLTAIVPLTGTVSAPH